VYAWQRHRRQPRRYSWVAMTLKMHCLHPIALRASRCSVTLAERLFRHLPKNLGRLRAPNQPRAAAPYALSSSQNLFGSEKKHVTLDQPSRALSSGGRLLLFHALKTNTQIVIYDFTSLELTPRSEPETRRRRRISLLSLDCNFEAHPS
jgi:hypothetical protein